MKPVRLHFSRGPSWRLWLAGRGAAASAWFALPMLAAALAATAGVAWQVWDAQGRLQAAQQAVEAHRHVKGPGRPSAGNAGPAPMTAQQRQAWGQMARHLNTPWSALLDVLEAATPQAIALVAIEPDARTGSVRLQVEAKALDPLLAYASELRAIEWFDSVSLVKHETNEQDPSRPLRLTLDIRLQDKAPAAQPETEGPR